MLCLLFQNGLSFIDVKLVARKDYPIDSDILVDFESDNITDHDAFLESLHDLAISFDLDP